jgi:uncharacterized membrane protein
MADVVLIARRVIAPLAAVALVLAALAMAGPASASGAPTRLAPSAPGLGLGGVSDLGLDWRAERGRARPSAATSQPRPARARSRGHAFVRDARGFATIDVPGASVTAAFASNTGGQIVGAYIDARGRFHGFLRAGRRFRTIDFRGAEGTFAAAINDRGNVVGSYNKERGTPVLQSEHGFLLDERDRFRRIDVPGASETRPAAINNRDQIAGEYVDRAGRSHGYLQDVDGSVITIDAPGADATMITDVDDQGRAVGVSVDARQTAIQPFVRDPDGRFTTIANPDAGFYGTQPEGINNEGQIAGSYSDANDRRHGFVLDDGVFTTVDAPRRRATPGPSTSTTAAGWSACPGSPLTAISATGAAG